MKTETQQVIETLQENINRLNAIINQGFWNKGYIANCKEQIAGFEAQIKKLQS